MSDVISAAIRDLVLRADRRDVPATVSDRIKDRIADSMLLAAASWREDAVIPIEKYVRSRGLGGASRAWGARSEHRPYEAALLNGTAARVLDYNDAFFARDSSHPSDVIPALVAVAESIAATIDELSRAIDVAYHVILAFSDHVKARASGWDHAMTTGLGACCGVAVLLRLSAPEVENAVSIYCTSSQTGRQTRAGVLTSWKAVAAPFSTARAIEACELASCGAVGPSEPFLGIFGYLTSSCRDNFDEVGLLAALGPEQPSVVRRTHLKLWPVGYLAHSALDTARTLHTRRAGRQLRGVRILTFEAAAEIMDSAEKRWPVNRETADHSLGYSVMAVLDFGRITSSVFDAGVMETNGVREQLRDLVTIESLDRFTARYPAEQPARVEVDYADGTTDFAEMSAALGHASNPAEHRDLVEKFRALFDGEDYFGPFRSTLDQDEGSKEMVGSFWTMMESVLHAPPRGD